MNPLARRDFLRQGSWGLAAMGALGLTLKLHAEPTESSGELGAPSVNPVIVPPVAPLADRAPTENNILGPYHRQGAPFRAKITPPLEPGETLVVRGRVWAFDSKQPLAGATLDIWQANAAGRYDNDDPDKPPAKGVYVNRARLVTDETGYYEYETIKPGRYSIGPNRWRPAHIHYLIAAQGYKTLVTQLYFAGDPMNGQDEFIKKSLIISPEKINTPGGQFLLGTFDIVLAKA